MKLPLAEYLSLLARYLRPQWPRVAALGILLGASVGMELVNPQVMRHFLDSALTGRPQSTLTAAALLFLALALADQVAVVLATYLSENVGWTATNALRADLAEHCLRLDLGFHKERTPGELIERIDGDVSALTAFFSQFVVQLLTSAALLVGILALLFREDWRIGLPVLGFALLSLAALSRLQGIAVPHWIAARQASADFYGFLEERLSGTEDLRANGATEYVMRRFFEQMRNRLRREQRAGLSGSMMGAATVALFTLGTALAFVIGALLFRTGEITLGSVYLIFHYTEMLNRPLQQIVRQLEELQKAGAGIARIRELLDVRSRLEEGPGVSLPAGAPEVRFAGVSFEYTPGEPVLRAVSFTLAPGRALGLVGRTGSGKSTLARLLFRLYDPEEGSILLAGEDIRRARLTDLRARLGMVTQEIQLFRGTLRENLTLFDSSIPDDRVRAALEELGLGEWLDSLPQGLDTPLDAGGSGLSAGEAQLLAFARVFLRDPSVVILDEASSRLDPATERRIEEATARLLRGRTAIVIAHRLATLEQVDEILVLEEGSVREHGERRALAADTGSRFAALLRAGLAGGAA